MGALYPFSLADKLAAITENSRWYADDAASPWRRAIVPLEMVGLFADQEIRMIRGPLFVGEPYRLRREIVALSDSRRTESYWVRTRIFDAAGTAQLAEMLLNHATLKASYDGRADAPAR